MEHRIHLSAVFKNYTSPSRISVISGTRAQRHKKCISSKQIQVTSWYGLFDKTDSKTKLIKRDREGYYILNKGKVKQEDIEIYASKFISEMLLQLKSNVDPHTVMVSDSNIPFSSMDRLFTQNLKKKMVELNNAINQKHLKDTYRTSHLNTKEKYLIRSLW